VRRNVMSCLSASGLGAALALVGVLLLMPALAQNASGAFPGRNGKIVFSGPDGIYAINADGSGQARIRKGLVSQPSWSADGRRIAFKGRTGIAVMNPAGGQMQTITRPPGRMFDEAPAWSPDGTRLAFTRHLRRLSDLYVVDVRTRVVRQLTRTPQVIESDPAWSPDGKWILFGQTPTSMPRPPTVLRRTDPTGRSNVPITNASAFGATWSPDGKKIAFASDLHRASDIWVVNAKGLGTNATGLENLTPDSGASNADPAWSPDGHQIAFMSTRDSETGYYDIWVMGSDGSSPKRLTSFGARSTQAAGSPDWQPLR
jgi:dipeptidyl aminopeptidase/acylaminoacyl peptidase